MTRCGPRSSTPVTKLRDRGRRQTARADTVVARPMSTTSYERIQLPIEGMTCASCATRIEKRLNKLEGVEATVNYATENAAISFDPARVAPEELVATVGSAGYHATLAVPGVGAKEHAEVDPVAPLRRRLIVSAALSLPVLLLAMIEPLQFDYWQWLSLLLATPVVLWGGWPFHRAAWLNLKHATATMDTLISVGTLCRRPRATHRNRRAPGGRPIRRSAGREGRHRRRRRGGQLRG
jgi:copper chaperone CopZ